MHIKYYTQKGSIYIHTVEDSGYYWVKEDADGGIHPLVEALHISKDKLQELISEYPSSLLDKTLCFDMGVEKEFFDDADHDLYGIGCSSRVVKIEKTD